MKISDLNWKSDAWLVRLERIMRRRFFLFLTVAALLLNAWFFAELCEPSLQPPSQVAVGFGWLKDGRLFEGRHPPFYRAWSAANLRSEVAALVSGLQLVGPFSRPPLLVLDLGDSGSKIADDQALIFSEDGLTQSGQLTKAFMRRWVQQRWSHDDQGIANSLLRREVLSDALTAILRNDKQVVPGANLAEPDELKSWSDWIFSHRDFCRSPWMSLEIHVACSGELSEGMSALGFRPLLASMIWSLYSSTSPLERAQFVRNWLKALDQNATSVSITPFPDHLEDVSAWLGTEFRSLYPLHHMPETMKDRALALLARLGLSSPGLRVPFAFHLEGSLQASEELVKSARIPRPLQDRTLAVSLGQNDLWLVRLSSQSGVLQRIQLRESDRNSLKPDLAVFRTCESKTVARIMSIARNAQRVLYVEACRGDYLQEWSQIMSGGVASFARERRDTAFALMRPSSVALALRMGQLRGHRRAFAGSPRSAAGLLGLKTAAWVEDLGAYRVNGAIEAFELIRAPDAFSPRKRAL
jgi:hypothetical protein